MLVVITVANDKFFGLDDLEGGGGMKRKGKLSGAVIVTMHGTSLSGLHKQLHKAEVLAKLMVHHLGK
jgi:hypothetical protein